LRISSQKPVYDIVKQGFLAQLAYNYRGRILGKEAWRASLFGPSCADTSDTNGERSAFPGDPEKRLSYLRLCINVHFLTVATSRRLASAYIDLFFIFAVSAVFQGRASSANSDLSPKGCAHSGHSTRSCKLLTKNI
jgi:hypothetical protein